MNAERYCAYNLTRQRFVATDVEAADGVTNKSELRLLELGPGQEIALWIFPYRKLSSSSARFPIDLVLLDSNSTVLDTVEFFPMNIVGEEDSQAASVLVLAADSVAQGGIKAGDQLAISAPAEMMLYLQRAENGNGAAHAVESARVIPWPKDPAKVEEETREPETKSEVRDESAGDADGVEECKPKEANPIEVLRKEEPAKEESKAIASRLNEGARAKIAAELPAHEVPEERPVIAANKLSESKSPQIAAELPRTEEPAEGPQILAGARTEKIVQQIPAELPLEEERVIAADPSNWLSPIPVQAELPWGKTLLQSPIADKNEHEDETGPQLAAVKATKETAISADGIGKTIPVSTASPSSIESPGKIEQAPVAADAPRKTEPAPASPDTQPGHAPRKFAANGSTPIAAASVSHVARFELRPVNAPPIPIESHLVSDDKVPASRRRQWTNDAHKNWLLRLLGVEGRDPRKMPRESLPGLVAYFFTGGAPTPHAVRDISMSGLYLVTYERWYKGTVVQMTLTDRHRSTQERSLTLYAQAVRLGSDGVGFRFVVEEDRRRNGRVIDLFVPTNGIDRPQVGRFLRRFKTTQPEWR